MTPISGGEFSMGSPIFEKSRLADEGPIRKVKVDSFWMAKYETTWDLFNLFVSRNLDDLQPNYDKKSEVNIDVDAISGATPQYIKDQTIEGALYTCHALWSLCRGKIKEQLLNYTENNLLNDDLMHQMILSDDLKLIEFSFQHLSFL